MHPDPVVAEFMALMRGASHQECLRVLHADRYRQYVYVFDPDSRSVFLPDADTIPWDVGLLLGKYHRKHRISRATRPRLDAVMTYVSDFCNKLQWRWLFRHSDSVRPFKVPSTRAGPPCDFNIAPELRCWTSFFQSHMRRACTRALSRHMHNPRRWSNRTALDSFSVGWIRNSDYAIIPTDKDGGYCLVPRGCLRDAHREILQKSWYEEFPIEFLPPWKCVAEQYVSLAHKIARVERQSSMVSLITSSLRYGNDDGLVRTLDITVKSHKPAGEVSFRNIHAGGPYPFAGLGAWLMHRLRNQLSGLPHLLRNTDELIAKLRSFESEVPIKLVKVDIKDYFMSGTAATLTEHGASMMAQPFQKAGMEVIGFLLSHQYVRSHLFTDQVWRVLVGAGMGLNFSGDLCDAAFFSMSEAWFVHNQGLRDQTGILLYVRFRDDVFMILRDGLHTAFCEFMERWREKAGCFKLVVEAISRSQLTVLDLSLEITKSVTAEGRCRYRVGFQPHFKPTSLGVPLSTASSHPWHVHASWPFSQIKRLHRLSGSRVCFSKAKHAFISRLQDNFEPSTLIKALCEYIPPIRNLRWEECAPEPEADSVHSRVLWMVVPYHFVWEAACLAKQANEFLHSTEAKTLWMKAWGTTPVFRIGMAWKVTAPSVASFFKRL